MNLRVETMGAVDPGLVQAGGNLLISFFGGAFGKKPEAKPATPVWVWPALAGAGALLLILMMERKHG